MQTDLRSLSSCEIESTVQIEGNQQYIQVFVEYAGVRNAKFVSKDADRYDGWCIVWCSKKSAPYAQF